MIHRQAEAELMDSPAQVQAYAEGNFQESDQAFVQRLLQRLQPLPAHGTLIDLGCGPAGITMAAASVLPGWQLTALDAGANMLARARQHINSLDPDTAARLRLLQAHLPEHGQTGSFAVIISNSLLHHLPDPMVLWRCVQDLGNTGSLVQVMDLYRPHSETRLQQLVKTYAADAAEPLRQDFANSLRAAYVKEEIADQLAAAGLQDLQVALISDRHVEISGRL